MNQLILAVAGLGALIGLGFYLNRPGIPAVSPAEAQVGQTAREAIQQPEPKRAAGVGSKQPLQNPAERSATNPAPPSAVREARFAFNQAIETLVSVQATYDQKQAAWKQLKDSGNLDQAISELEQRRADDLQKAEYPAALGEAYLKKCAIVQDIRKQAVLAMKADQMFDEALDLDLFNWDARFTKAVGMSYWPQI